MNDTKKRQLEIILKNNPADDSLSYHTWIRSEDDIRTFDEALENDGYDGGGLTPDYTDEMVNRAKKTGKITVYSSYPIKDGIFVTPSRMEAQSYAGGGRVYSKEISVNDVAWIDGLQGQYAKVGKSNAKTASKGLSVH